MDIAVIGPNYSDFQLCTVVDGLQALGHTVYEYGGPGRSYMTSSLGPFGVGVNLEDVKFFIIADTDNSNACAATLDLPKVIIHGHDRWTDYLNVPNSPLKPISYDKWNCDIAFVRDWDGTTNPRFPVYPMEFSVERRFVQACQRFYPWFDRHFDVAFFGTEATAGRHKVLQLFKDKLFRCNFGNQCTFMEPDDYWSKWVTGRYTHAPKYYEALCDAIFALSPLGAGPSCGRTYEGYAAGCIPLIQRYPEEIQQIVPFVDEENCILWTTPEELIEKVADYINYQPDALNELQMKCFEFSNHNLQSKHRAQFILDKMEAQGLL
jgi:hypothetical protein